MKKILLPIFALFVIASNPLKAENSGVYVGLGYAYTQIDITALPGEPRIPEFDLSTDSLIMLAGFDLNQWIGIEGRYYLNLSTAVADEYNHMGLLDEYEAESFAIYIKPQYSLDVIAFYALLGLSMNDYTLLAQSSDDTLFSWGAGVKLRLTDSFGAFVDYTDLGDSEKILSTDLSSWNFGLTFKF